MEKISDLQIMCDNIKLLRLKNNLSQSEMADKLKIKAKTLQDIENGVVPPRLCCEILFHIQHHFAISPRQLFIPIEDQ